MTTNALHNIAGSITAGCFSTILGHPLDTIKVHQQTSAHNFKNPSSSLHVAKELCQGNVLRLFKGIGPPMANQIIMNTVMFSVFHKVKEVTSQSGMDNRSASLCSGLVSGFATACVSTPFDWFKIQAQLSLTQNQGSSGSLHAKTNARRTDVLSICKYLWHDTNQQMTKVIQTIYRGHIPNLAREGVFTMVYLGTYDLISSAVKEKRYQQSNQQQQHLPMQDVIMISSFTGACAWICNYPFDTIKSVMQSSKKKQGVGNSSLSIDAAIRSIYKSGGLTSFFRGMGPSTFRAMLVTSARMIAYEKTLQILGG